MPKAPSGCRKSGLRHFFEVFIAPLRLWRGQGAMQGNPWSARLFSHLPHTPRGGTFARLPAPSAQPTRRAGARPRPGGGAAAFGGRGPLAPGLPNQMAGAGPKAPAPAICGRFAPCRRPPRLANRQTPMRAGAAGPALCALRPPYSSGQTYRPLPLVFSPYWMAWTGQRLMQLVQR